MLVNFERRLDPAEDFTHVEPIVRANREHEDIGRIGGDDHEALRLGRTLDGGLPLDTKRIQCPRDLNVRRCGGRPEVASVRVDQVCG